METIQAVLFDFGGVLAEEGFQAGLYTIADRYGLDRQEFFQVATEAVYISGYVTGTGSEAIFWQKVKTTFGITAPDSALRHEIVSRFIPRPQMIALAKAIQARGCITAILSDQSDWLDLLDMKYHFFKEFDAVFNSYHIGKTKRDPTIFNDTIKALGVKAGEALFIDDNPGHVLRATGRGLRAHLFTDRLALEVELKQLELL